MKILLLAIAILVVGAGSFAQEKTAPALPQDRHDGMTVSVDAYTTAGRAKQKLGKVDPFPLGILPVEVFFKNETNDPVKLDMDTIQLTVHNGTQHQDLDWLDPVEVADFIAHPKGPTSPGVRRFPLGLNIPRDDKRDKVLQDLRPFTLDADIVPPHGTIHGFLFFNVGRDMPALADTSLYVPDLTVATTQKPLMFFEVMLGKAGAASNN